MWESEFSMLNGYKCVESTRNGKKNTAPWFSTKNYIAHKQPTFVWFYFCISLSSFCLVHSVAHAYFHFIGLYLCKFVFCVPFSWTCLLLSYWVNAVYLSLHHHIELNKAKSDNSNPLSSHSYPSMVAQKQTR